MRNIITSSYMEGKLLQIFWAFCDKLSDMHCYSEPWSLFYHGVVRAWINQQYNTCTWFTIDRSLPRNGGSMPMIYIYCYSLKASAHSFKQFTSRLLKLSFALSMHIYNSDGRHAWFHLHGTSRPDRSASEATKCKMKNSLSIVGLEPSTLNAVRLNDLITFMYSQYQCLPCYIYQNDEVERNLSCKCTVLCYILE